MPQGYSTRARTTGPRVTEKKLAKQPIKAPKEKFQLAKAAALEKRAAAKTSHTERKATFEANRGIRFTKDVHMYTGCPPDSGPKATRERTHRNPNGDAKGMKADGHGRRHEGLPGDDGWATKKGKGQGPFVWPPWDPNREPDHTRI